MNKFLKSSFILLSLIAFSCNSDSKKGKEPEASKTESDQVELIVEFKSPVNDKFNVFYTVAPNVEITGEHLMSRMTYGDNTFQKVVFKFPDSVVPYKIRLDVGGNQSVENLTIKNISLKYKDKVIDGDNGEFMKLWSPNSSLVYDEQNYVYKIVAVNGLKSPVFMANVELEKRLKKFRN
ncbi:MAG: hypothetical protein JNM71_06885 [Flavobacterium lindanitolerans]|jgi:hypothetical protein|uniref:hypothetical protein n=1 Tax=Flavobacterium lindanitolerans TaxID=428988 RepID=UPI001A5517F4|nr:hypothetical protein [Flavobacterium lindanitolerans]MBL7867728.1 hypothetical protein [Flavobacterium lindanitolerans]